MTVLVAAVVVLAVVVVFNLLITFAVLRRLRGREERLAGPAGAGDPGAELLGRMLPEFATTSTGGEPVTNVVDAERLVGFFSATCLPCREQAAEFARQGDPGRLAIVLMEGAPAADQDAILAALADSPTVVTDPTSTELAAAMGVRSFPQILRFDAAGVVVGARRSVRALATTGG